MIVSQDGFRELSIAGWTCACLSRILMNRESWRVDSKLNELAWAYLSLDDIGWNLEVDGILCVHENSAHQLILVGELLVVKLLI